MNYESSIRTLRTDWPAGSILNRCVFLSQDLGEILQKEFPDSQIYTARSENLQGERIVGWANHQVSVIKEGGNGFVAIDATRPSYEEGQEYWEIKASTEEELLKKLSEHYTGDWRLNRRYDTSKFGFLEIPITAQPRD